MNRREWLRASAWSAAGLALGLETTACGKQPREEELRAAEVTGVKLNSNESPYGPPPGSREALVRAVERSHLYPHWSYPDFRTAIAEREGTAAGNIVLGAGSTEVMTMLIHMAAERGGALTADPTYFDFVSYAEAARCPLHSVPVTDHFVHDLDGMAAQIGPDIALVYICNPLNPTGTIVPRNTLQTFCESASRQTLVVVDEAYHEYVDDPSYGSMAGLVREGRNVVVTRTFSKIYGMAGLRVGYGIGPARVIESLDRFRMNFASIACTSLSAARAALGDSAFVLSCREKNRAARSYLFGELNKLGLAYIPSHTNFVLFEVPREAREIQAELEERGVLVRPFGIKDKSWIRVSIGTQEEMEAFVSTLHIVI
jgi:histidinol-phosphate aminotransferase